VGLACVRLDGKFGYIDTTGNVVIEPQFDDARDFANGLARVELDFHYPTEYGYINTKGKMIIEPQFSEASDFYSNGLAKVWTNGYYGCVDRTGKMVIDPIYAQIRIIDNKILVGRSSIFRIFGLDWGIVDMQGNIIVKPKFDWIIHR
ncbi:MAG: WG repeat-containing protein, partial [Bacteroidales bacterium]|nr:WG repeat-containing protein [Bacteroidales bacterium]